MPIVVVSANYRAMAAGDAAQTAAEIGATAVLPKPFEIEDLTRLVTDVLEGNSV
ncbi:MAG: hypothetical protein ISR51_07370 [Rhodospirillales bacterium]|nr:hypothetical protein [Alphaproteobacteria bacterium]MBL6948481.1 hypothetical protein [Rhodospirillales bacterium]